MLTCHERAGQDGEILCLVQAAREGGVITAHVDATRAQDKRVDFFTPQTRRLVGEIYAADFKAFGYAPD